MGGEETLASVGDSLTEPADENELGETASGVFDADEGVLDLAVAKDVLELVETAVTCG